MLDRAEPLSHRNLTPGLARPGGHRGEQPGPGGTGATGTSAGRAQPHLRAVSLQAPTRPQGRQQGRGGVVGPSQGRAAAAPGLQLQAGSAGSGPWEGTGEQEEEQPGAHAGQGGSWPSRAPAGATPERVTDHGEGGHRPDSGHGDLRGGDWDGAPVSGAPHEPAGGAPSPEPSVRRQTGLQGHRPGGRQGPSLCSTDQEGAHVRDRGDSRRDGRAAHCPASADTRA